MKNKFDEIEYKSIDRNIIKRLLTFLKPYKKSVFISIALTLTTAALGPLRPYLNKLAIDDYIVNSDMNGLLIMVFIIIVLLLLHGLIQFSLTYLMQTVGQKVLYDIRMQLLKHLSKLSLKFYDSHPVGRLVTRVTNDVEGLNEMFSSGVVMIVADILLIFWIIGFMFYTNSELALISLSILPLLLIVTSVFRKKVRVVFRDIRANVAKMNSFINEYLAGINIVKLYNQQKNQSLYFDNINQENKNLWIKTIWYYSIFFPSIEMISTIALGLIIWYAAGNVIGETMTIGTLIAFLQYSEMFFRPVRDLTEKYTTLQSAMASSERIFALLDTKVSTKGIQKKHTFDRLKSKIEFKNVFFSYEEDKQVLKDVSFEIKQGETVAIVGATGSGKSTLINLFFKFYTVDRGEILIDGVNINDINEEDLRSKTALVMQDVFLSSGDIKHNITLGREIDNIKIQDAIKSIGAEGFIANLENGYETAVMERGKTLSTGQRQLISFARAYLSNPDILILDEATSNIDSETESLIEKSLELLLRDKTSLIIAHRLSTIKRANKIIVLHHGKIREVGTHEELIKGNDIYAMLYKLQFN